MYREWSIDKTNRELTRELNNMKNEIDKLDFMMKHKLKKIQ